METVTRKQLPFIRIKVYGLTPKKSYCQQPGCLGRRNCAACRNIYARATRKRHADLTPAQRQRANCRAYANVYQRRGLLVPQPCEVCGARDVQKHHDDYAQPLAVRWLCRAHQCARATAPAPAGDRS